MGLPERLIALRKKAKISQKELAEEIDVSQASIGYWERGQRAPSIDAVQKIAKYFNVTTSYLVGQGEKSQTYADVIDLLVKTESALKFELDPQHANCITICDKVMQCFLDDWVKILPLFRNGTVDEKLYKLWIDDKLQEYKNVHIRNEDEIEEFLILMEVVVSPILSKPKSSEFQDEPQED